MPSRWLVNLKSEKGEGLGGRRPTGRGKLPKCYLGLLCPAPLLWLRQRGPCPGPIFLHSRSCRKRNRMAWQATPMSSSRTGIPCTGDFGLLSVPAQASVLAPEEEAPGEAGQTQGGYTCRLGVCCLGIQQGLRARQEERMKGRRARGWGQEAWGQFPLGSHGSKRTFEK